MQAEIFPVAVNYANGQFSYTPEQNDVVANLPQGNCVLVFTLSGDPGIAWAPNFITWTSSTNQPETLSELPMVANGNIAVLGIKNEVGGYSTYDFKVNITTPNGPVTSPDPDIVLDPPP